MALMYLCLRLSLSLGEMESTPRDLSPRRPLERPRRLQEFEVRHPEISLKAGSLLSNSVDPVVSLTACQRSAWRRCVH